MSAAPIVLTVDDMRYRMCTLLLVLVATALVAAGCGGGGGAPSAGAAPSAGGSLTKSSGITIDNFKFSPSTSRVAAGARVAVANNDSTAHTVTANDGSFDSGTVNPGDSTSFRAPAAGSYAYHCTIHPFMKGTLIVR
jgi:plastocyanin